MVRMLPKAPVLFDPEIDDEIDPEITQEAIFHDPPTVGLLISALLVFHKDLPVYVNGEGWATGIQAIDPSDMQPFRDIIHERHVVIG